MKYPLSLKFKIIAFRQKFSVTDSDDQPVFFVEDKLFMLKDKVEVFTSSTKEKKLCDITATKVIDWSSSYTFTDEQGNSLGGIRRKGVKSLWRARYEIYSGNDDEAAEFNVSEESVRVRIIDDIVGLVPILRELSGYFANPSYIVCDMSGNPVMRLRKEPAFLEGKFSIESLCDISSSQEARILLGLFLIVMNERERG